MSPEDQIIYTHCLARALLFNPCKYGGRDLFFNSWQVLESLLEFLKPGISTVVSSPYYSSISIAERIFNDKPPRIFQSDKPEDPHRETEIYWNFWQMLGWMEYIPPEDFEKFYSLVIEHGKYQDFTSTFRKLQQSKSISPVPPEVGATKNGGTAD